MRVALAKILALRLRDAVQVRAGRFQSPSLPRRSYTALLSSLRGAERSRVAGRAENRTSSSRRIGSGPAIRSCH